VILLVSALSRSAAAQELKTFHSDALGADKNYRIYLPPGYNSSEDRYPAVYLLHGYNFARNNPDKTVSIEEENHWMEQERIQPVADCLFTTHNCDALLACLSERGVEFPEAIVKDFKDEHPDCPLPLPETIVVMPDGDSSFYLDRKDELKTWPPLDGPEFQDGVRKGATGQYETYIHRDLVNHIDSTYRTIPDRGHRGVGGFSMGGIGSMNLLLGHPDVFISASSLSAVFTLSDMMNNPFARGMDQTSPEISRLFFYTNDKGKKILDKEFLEKSDPYFRLRDLDRKDVFIYYDAGDGDFFSGMDNFRTFTKFEKGLEKKGLKSYPSKHIIPGSEINGKGMHTGKYWRSRLGVLLAFHARAFGMLK